MQGKQSSPPSPQPRHLPSITDGAGYVRRQRKAGGGGGSLHNYYLLSSSQRINFQTITYFPTHTDMHTSLIWRGFIS